MTKLATPISHLFLNEEYRQKISNLSDCFECRDRSFHDTIDRQELFHCELQPIHEFSDEEWEYLKSIKETKKELKLITFHMACNCTEPILENNMFYSGGKIYTEEEMIINAKYNFSKIKKIFGKNIIIAVENNNYYPTPAYEIVTESSFIKKIVEDNDLNFLFDIAHAKVTSFNKRISYEKYKSQLPIDKIIQLHICTYAIDKQKQIAFDAHNSPDKEELLEVKKLIEEYNVKYLTVEYYKDIENLEKSLREVRKLI